jgi:hypothetical protein
VSMLKQCDKEKKSPRSQHIMMTKWERLKQNRRKKRKKLFQFWTTIKIW